ncbi:sensor histidine kinase [Microbacterium sp. RD1]|uniref:sensor histidine kinase n=1 Tax=Microbacterium sp. RD1 TaxID=3457313 RepID=UPI003FA5CA11
MWFLRTTLVANVDEQVRLLASSNIAQTVFETEVKDGVIEFLPRDDLAPTGSIVVVYGPGDGPLLAIYDGTSVKMHPDLPDTFPLQDTYIKLGEPVEYYDPDTGAAFRATVDVLPIDGVTDVFTQLVAVPLASTERVVASYIGIYGILALLILVASALLTRWLVTLTFRGLGQVENTAISIATGDFSQRLTDVIPGTEVGRLKAAINAMLSRVDAAIRQRDATVGQMRRFIGDASHELRTPLVTVRGYAELYRMGAIRGDEEIAQAMERIEKEAIRMGVLVEDLLALARLDERRDVMIVPVDLRPIARDAALDLRAASPLREVTVEDTTLAEGPQVTMTITVDPPLASSSPREEARRRPAATSAIALAGATLSRLRRRPRTASEPTDTGEQERLLLAPPEPIVLGDENRIRQVVANLLGNARRFTSDDSPIGLRIGITRAEESGAEADAGWIEIIDHGEGIPEQIREQIFQRFWRADTSRARETGGSGLGLSIVASIVEALHGTVSVSETPGGGATFRVAFPLAPPAAADEIADTRPVPRVTG